MTEEKKNIMEKSAKYIPAVEKPLYKQSFNKRIKWTLYALLMYLTLSNITAFGVGQSAYEQFRFFEIILGSKFGSLMTLGIGPIVTAGIFMQLFVGSKILDWDMNDAKYQEKFQDYTRVLTVIFTAIEAIAFVVAGAIPVQGGGMTAMFVMFQLFLGGMIVLFLDELISKWGFGSGVSLFIMAGVGTSILIGFISPVTVDCVARQFSTCIPSASNPPVGNLWALMMNILSGNKFAAISNFVPLFATVFVFGLVVYAQDIKVDIPLAFSSLRGFGRNWSLNLLYTSNIPVILVAALIANLQIVGQMGLKTTEFGTQCGFFGCFDQQNNPISGMVFYLSAPRDLAIQFVSGNVVRRDLSRAFTYALFMALASTLFSVFWVNTSGMDAESVADQIESAGMQIPGFRRDKRIIKSILDRYIPPLALVGGFLVGLLAAIADFMGAIGSGMGILLAVMIAYQYYEELRMQDLQEAHPLAREFLGG